MEELSKQYNPKEVENRIYKNWEEKDYFKPSQQSTVGSQQKPFVIVIPPPNVTGSLHMGHALNNTMIDILIRRARMQGKPTLYLPGTDHAGIATQNVVEKELKKEGLTRHDLGREKFIERVWEWKEKYGDRINSQLKKLGCSCDWTRERFTMDEGYSEAVKKAFLHYKNKGWIYQGERVINWCPRCQTALSDIEVEYKKQPTKLYYFKYDKDFPITIATTRPETKLGDTAVAVNPDDERYKQYINKSYKVNFAGQELDIKIIADPGIDPKFGTGAAGVTPAHSIADAEIAEKNNLNSITIIDKFGKMTSEAGSDYKGLKAKEAGEKVITWLKKNNLIEKSANGGSAPGGEENIENNLSVCYRCGSELEPQPSKQWFVKMTELAKPAIEAVESGKIKFYPERFNRVYLDWMNNLKDWCISRQIWWGHRLPVYTKQEEISNSQLSISKQIPNSNDQNLKNCNIENSLKNKNCKLKIYVGDDPPAGYKQVDDVLDTWFSSALWPFAVFLRKSGSSSKLKMKNEKLRKPIEIFGEDLVNDDLTYFYPTTILSTDRGIIYLWVSRMIFSGLEFMKEIPFTDIYIHPTVLTIDGQRMSKSLGTGVDPLDLIDKYGADAVRFGITYQNTGVQDMKFDENKILAGKKFANKIWNMSRFLMMNISDAPNLKAEPDPQTEADKQILASLENLIKSVNSDIDKYRFGQAAQSLYEFVWHEFADVYIEKSKEQLADEKLKESTQNNLLYLLTTSLKLLHPFMPHVTEEIWDKLPTKDDLIVAKWPS